MSVGEMTVALMTVGQKSRHHRLVKDFCVMFTHLFTADASPIVPRTIMPDSRVSERIDHLKMLNGPPQEIADQVRRSSKSFLIKFHEKHKS